MEKNGRKPGLSKQQANKCTGAANTTSNKCLCKYDTLLFATLVSYMLEQFNTCLFLHFYWAMEIILTSKINGALRREIALHSANSAQFRELKSQPIQQTCQLLQSLAEPSKVCIFPLCWSLWCIYNNPITVTLMQMKFGRFLHSKPTKLPNYTRKGSDWSNVWF